MSRCENNGFCSQWLGHDGLLVVVVHGPDHRSLEEHALGCLNHTLICFTGDVAGL